MRHAVLAMIGGPDNPCVFQQVTARRRTIKEIEDF
jgi:hypothetical protein